MSGNAHQRRQLRRHPNPVHDRRHIGGPVLNGNRFTDPVEILFDDVAVSGFRDTSAEAAALETFERKVRRSERWRNLLTFAVLATLGALVYLAIWAG